jgi:hypothetical protein
MIKITGIKKTIQEIERKAATIVQQKKKDITLQLVEKLAEATPVDTGEAQAGWKLESSSIVNDVEHIKFLNEGSSQQAPSHFVEKVVLSQPGIRPSGIIVVDN